MKHRQLFSFLLIVLLSLLFVVKSASMWHLGILAALLIGLWLYNHAGGLRVKLLNTAAGDTLGWRMRWISEPLLKLFRRITPAMSDTEREALEAGSVWWDGELFSGKPNWKKLGRLPAPKLSKEEQAFLDGPVETLCQMLNDWEITRVKHDLPAEIWQYLKEHGFFGLIIPREYGGLEFSALAHSAVVMKVATRSTSAAVTVMVPNSLGPAKLLLEYGTHEQKEYYLPRLARGEEIPCFALTSPDAGSDAGAIPDYGIVCRANFQGQENVLGLRLNWNKRYITLGPVATLLGLAFKLYDPEHLLGEEEDRGITLALIPTDTPGVNIGNRHVPLSMVFMNGPNSGKDVFIPLNWIIGGPERAGQGWRMLMESLSDGRGISLPALSTGAAKLTSRYVGGYARIRQQFKLPIGRFEGIEEALARIGAYTYMLDAARNLTLVALDRGEKPSVISAIVKYHLTEGMRQVVNDAMDILGGAGICLGPRNIMGRVYEGLPISITVEGANILTRSMIIFGQGATRSHPYIYQEMEALSESEEDFDTALGKFDHALFGHIFFFLRNLGRTFWHGLSGAWFAFAPGHGVSRRYYQKLTHMSAVFALLADINLMLLGGSLKRREKISARLGDILSYLYLASATLKQYSDQGEQEADQVLLRWSCDHALHQIQDAIDGLLQNMPYRPISWWLRLMIFPFGRHYTPPADQLGQQVAELLLAPSPTRDRLTAGIYLPHTLDDTLGRIEDALQKVILAEPIERKLRRQLREFNPGPAGLEGLIQEGLAQQLINDDDVKILRQAADARQEVITVDDFPPDFGKES